MAAESDLTALQLQTRATTRALGAIHACEASLRRGTYRSLYSDAETWVFARELEGADSVVVVAMRNPSGSPSVPLPGIAAGQYVDLLSGHQSSLQPELTIFGAEPFSVALYVPTGSACANLAP
jgi:hypothetical protein